MEDPASWKVEHDRGLTPFSDFKRGNLSVTRNRGREDDRGDYVCSLKFKKGVNLNSTLHVNVLQSKLKKTPPIFFLASAALNSVFMFLIPSFIFFDVGFLCSLLNVIHAGGKRPVVFLCLCFITECVRASAAQFMWKC